MSKDPASPRAADLACVAFAGQTCIASGALPSVVREAKQALDANSSSSVIILDAVTSEPIEVDFRGTPDEVIARVGAYSADADMPRPLAVGRPKLGVVGREVTLLPRHWEWLAEQPGGASVTLRKLVEEARRSTVGEATTRRAREACYRFATIMAGDEPGYEDAIRALFSGDQDRFDTLTEGWPADVRGHARRLFAAGIVTR
jgi:hypothetical protein